MLLRPEPTGNSDASPVLIHFHAPESLLYQQFQQPLQREQKQGETSPLLPVTARHPGPAKPRYGIPREEWPTVVRRVVENQEPLRRVAGEYQVSYETIRRIVRTVQKQEKAV